MLPQISGYELFSYINEYSIPVIFITARGELDDKRKAFRMGADDYIVKPFSPREGVARKCGLRTATIHPAGFEC